MTKSRKSFSFRLQPYDGTPMAEVADYLNSLDSGSAMRKVEDLLVLGLLAYARLEQGAESERLRLTCLECCDALDKHATTLRLAIGVDASRTSQVPERPTMNDPGRSERPPSEPNQAKATSIAKQIGSVFGDDD